MKHSLLSKVFALLIAGMCASCSSPGQSVQEIQNVEKMNTEALSIGIESGSKQRVAFYVVNNTPSDIQMLVWNTPFEKILSADIFTFTRDGERTEYLGRMVKRGTPSSDNYLKIPAGEKLSSSMDIADYYDVSEAGKYTVTFNLVQTDGVFMLNQETAVSIEVGTIDIIVGK